MLKLKDIVWGEIDFVDENAANDDSRDEYDPNLGIIVVAMCCSGGGRPIGTDNGPWYRP